jgi:hypothetical protein
MNMRIHGLPTPALLCLCAAGCAAPEIVRPAPTVVELEVPETAPLEGDARGFPALRDTGGRTLADGEFTQWIERERLHSKIRYTFEPGHWIEEHSVIRQEPKLVQERWSWVEVQDEAIQRRFDVDFLSGNATGEKLEKGEFQRWSEHVDVEPGHAFAGAAWALAVKSVRSRLLRGEKLEFQTVGFTPRPRAATVEISYVGLDRLPMAGRNLEGDHFRIHPEIPWIARAFVDVPDSQIWLTHPSPAAFLRFEGPLAEPNDALVRVDLLPGEPSGSASRVTK